ncbi:hypothetical protein [Pilimelia anulata]|uniref:hypothetical protein n=1 Tax=Pilimelia anulata TaxID=53371 RepID=UPI00166BD5B3|nr:hypothetical protein [Pilimelia anulata]
MLFTCFVPVSQLLRNVGQVGRQQQDQGVGLPAHPNRLGELLLQHPPGGHRLVRRPVHPHQLAGTVQHVRVARPPVVTGGGGRGGQQLGRPGHVPLPVQLTRPIAGSGQGCGIDTVRLGHAAMLPPNRARRHPGMSRLPARGWGVV